MNLREKEMVTLLKKGRDNFGYVATKAEFEAEGTRIDELHRLLDLASAAGLKVALKIGGCEAIRDLQQAKQCGVHYIIAPMVESVYALEKYSQAAAAIYNDEGADKPDFLFNMETGMAFNNREEICSRAAELPNIAGVVFGRVDYTGSLQLSRDTINTSRITDDVCTVATLSKKHGLDLVVGGGVANESMGEIERIHNIHLNRFETRKVVFEAQTALSTGQIQRGLKNAVEFELLWLLNKQDYYNGIAQEDQKRIDMMQKRKLVLQEMVQ